MGKYYAIFMQNIHDLLAYRLRIILMIFSNFVTPVVMLLILQTVNNTAGLSTEQIIRYYIFTTILSLTMQSSVDEFVSDSVEGGLLAIYLTKPIQFWLVALADDISSRLLKLLFGIPVFLTLIIVYARIIPKITVESIISVSFIIIISFSLSFALCFALGLLAFWIEELWGLQNLKDVMTVLLGGIALPYEFFPVWLQKSLVYTPFPYLVNWPLRMGFSGNFSFEVLIALLWIVICALLAKLFWSAGLKRYSALGTY